MFLSVTKHLSLDSHFSAADVVLYLYILFYSFFAIVKYNGDNDNDSLHFNLSITCELFL